MRKQQVSLTDPQVEWLEAEAKRLGVSIAEVIRRIIDKHREQRENRE